jgi:hypothetical protein
MSRRNSRLNTWRPLASWAAMAVGLILISLAPGLANAVPPTRQPNPLPTEPLQHRAHGAIRDDDTLGECGAEISRPRRAEVSRRLSGTQAIGHLVRIVAVDTLWWALTTMWRKHLSLNRRLQ